MNKDAMNIKINHDTKTICNGRTFIILSSVDIDGYNVLRRRYTNCHDYDSTEWWMDFIGDKTVPEYAEYMNPYDDQGWLSFDSLKDCYKYIKSAGDQKCIN